MRGRLIVIEGLDGVGKTTLSKGLAEALGARWMTTPGAGIRQVRERFDAAFERSPIARCLAYAATVIAAGTDALEHCLRGGDVVLDRYWLSTCAYAPELMQGLLERLEESVVPADVTLYAWAPEPVRRARLTGRGLSKADAETLVGSEAARLDRRYRTLMSAPSVGHFIPILASGTPEENLHHALAAVRGFTP